MIASSRQRLAGHPDEPVRGPGIVTRVSGKAVDLEFDRALAAVAADGLLGAEPLAPRQRLKGVASGHLGVYLLDQC